MRPAAWRVGLFALLGMGLLALVTVVASGGWFAASERAVMRFDSSVFGLQTGAPVVFRGVRVGQVGTIGFAPGAPGGLAVPVTAEFDRELLRDLQAAAGAPAAPVGRAADGAPSHSAVKALVARGLVARLALQSLLTGQLYVDLDFDAERAAAAAAVALTPDGLPLIPTEATRLQTLQTQLEGLDLAQIGRDVAAVAAAMRQLLAGPEPARALSRTADAAQALEALALRLERDIAPLALAARGSLDEGRRTLQDLGRAAQQVAGAASQVQALAQDGSPVLAEVQRAAAELGLAAASLRAAAGEDSTLRGEAERALRDVSRAARALREVGETLERHPDALLRGRAAPP